MKCLSPSQIQLLFADGAYRALTGTGTTGDAGIGIDYRNTGFHADCAYRARTGTSTATYASVAYYKCHILILPIN